MGVNPLLGSDIEKVINKHKTSQIPLDDLSEKQIDRINNKKKYHSIENQKYPFILFDEINDYYYKTFNKYFKFIVKNNVPQSKLPKSLKNANNDDNILDYLNKFNKNKNRSFSENKISKKSNDDLFCISPIILTQKSRSFYKNELDTSFYIDLDAQFSKMKEKNNLINTNKNKKSIPGEDVKNKKTNKADKLRYLYIEKLIITKVWSPNIKNKSTNTIFVFDWDDTLMCSTFLIPTGLYNDTNRINLPKKEKAKIMELDGKVFNILSQTIYLGHVYIITNAGPGWVEFSSSKYYPTAKELINQVTVISARGRYQNVFSGDTRMWKIQAFKEVAKKYDKNLPTNIICFGDSVIEMDAGHQAAELFKNSFIKTIKFQENPNPSELLKELKLIEKDFMYIYTVNKNLAIRVEKSE